ncbi:heterokaryon incompatibility protein-domain-containing protein [Phyllosticta capitalensis]|uniref:heterokaryon incompatibility protein-domain-containing protein n=1 Tax=Phyllosticta capitalensis TaxID=121624 RepID=UPI0031328461
MGLEEDDPLAFAFAYHDQKDSKCGLCTSLLDFYQKSNASNFITFERKGTLICAHFQDSVEPDADGRQLDIEVELTPSDDPSIPLHVFPLSASTDSPKAFAQLRDWLDICLRTHERCNLEKSSGFLPSRLLKLWKIPTGKEFSLVLRDECLPDTRYMTLSHCWGDATADNKLRLLNETYHALRQGQSLSSLPRTFLDAFDIVDKLNLQYLWIDQLCIFQDSKEDWSNESAAMQDVYRHSFLNVSAHGAFDDKDGCFFERDGSQTPLPWMNINLGSNQRPQNFTCKASIAYYIDYLTSEGSVVHRGWILQERLLAPRVVHFGRQQMLWECNTSTSCESFPENLSKFDFDGLPNGATRPTWKNLIGGEADASVLEEYFEALGQELLRDWIQVVSDYSKTRLSFSSDKLVAISGLANDMKKRLREGNIQPQKPLDDSQDSVVYLAGIWNNMLPLGLLWELNFPRSPRPEYRAPSWSWASVEGHIIFINAFSSSGSTTLLASVDHIEVVPLRDETGEVLDGTLTMTSPIFVARISRRPQGSRSSAIQEFPHLPCLKTSDLYSADVVWDTTEKLEEVHCLPIAWRSWSPPYAWCRNSLKGLALKPVGDKFSRVGRFGIRAEEHDTFEEFLQQIPKRTVTII